MVVAVVPSWRVVLFAGAGDDDSGARNYAEDVGTAITALLRTVGQGTANVWTSTVQVTEEEAVRRLSAMLEEMSK